MTVWVGEERHRLLPGGIAFLPRNIPHAVRCDIASRMLVLSTPGGFQETVFRTAGWDLSRPMPDGWEPTPGLLIKQPQANRLVVNGSGSRRGFCQLH